MVMAFTWFQNNDEVKEENQEKSTGFLNRLRKGLSKTHKVLSTDINDLFAGNREIGDELLEDLRIFISKLGGKLAQPVAEQGEKIHTVRELAEAVGVSTKTIYRWRKRGLIPRRYVFPDGMRRLGFMQSKVDKFIEANPELVGRAKDFARLTGRQKQQIVTQAARLTAGKDLSRRQIINRISARTGRSPETIRYTLRNYEQANPQKAAFRKSGGAIEPAQAAEIYRLFKQGCDVKELMKRFDRNKSSIYRIINRRRAKALRIRKIEFVASGNHSGERIGSNRTFIAQNELPGENIARIHINIGTLRNVITANQGRG